MISKVLFVDDDSNVLEAVQRLLRKQFTVETSLGGAEALKRINRQDPYAVIVADMQMPGMNGIEFLQQAERCSPDSVRIMMTGNADQGTAVAAVNEGRVFRFLTKPCPTEMLIEATRAGLHHYNLVVAERELLEKTLNGAVKILMDVLSAMDPRSFGRGRQLRDLVRTFLVDFKVSQPWEIELAAMLTPIGRVTLPPALLAKERNGQPLTSAENDMLMHVPEVGADLLKNIPRLENVATLVRLQNKGFDGSGFPANVAAGKELPIGARILKVLGDLVPVENPPCSRAAALQRMQLGRSRYDPEVLEALLASMREVAAPVVEKPVEAGLVQVSDLLAGNTLAADVKTIDGMIVGTAGTVLSPMLLQRLKNFRAMGSVGPTVMIRP